MAGVGGDDRSSDDEPRGVGEVFLADDFAQLFDDSGEHAARLIQPVLLAEERATGCRIVADH